MALGIDQTCGRERCRVPDGLGYLIGRVVDEFGQLTRCTDIRHLVTGRVVENPGLQARGIGRHQEAPIGIVGILHGRQGVARHRLLKGQQAPCRIVGGGRGQAIGQGQRYPAIGIIVLGQRYDRLAIVGRLGGRRDDSAQAIINMQCRALTIGRNRLQQLAALIVNILHRASLERQAIAADIGSGITRAAVQLTAKVIRIIHPLLLGKILGNLPSHHLRFGGQLGGCQRAGVVHCARVSQAVGTQALCVVAVLRHITFGTDDKAQLSRLRPGVHITGRQRLRRRQARVADARQGGGIHRLRQYLIAEVIRVGSGVASVVHLLGQISVGIVLQRHGSPQAIADTRDFAQAAVGVILLRQAQGIGGRDAIANLR